MRSPAEFRTRGRKRAAIIRVGAIDSAAAGLLPRLLHDFRSVSLMSPCNWSRTRRSACCRVCCPAGSISPSCARRSGPTSGWSFCSCCTRPPSSPVAERHPLASRKRVTIADLENAAVDRARAPLASALDHDLTMKLFAEAGCEARRPDRRREADHRQSGLRRIGRRHRPALDLAQWPRAASASSALQPPT